jgi:transcriptional regulator with XRE-family HTH domain
VTRNIEAKFGKRVREIRERMGLTQEQLADRSGLHRTYIGGIERGERNPSVVNVVRIAEALGVRVGELFD